MAWTQNQSRYISDLLHGIGAPNTLADRRALLAWQRAEGGSARYNPFNTTQGASGASAYNSVGVRNYTSYQQGLQATIQTLKNGHYGGVLQALRQGRNPYSVAQAVGNSPWGTSGSLMSSVLKGMGAVPGAAPKPAGGRTGGSHGPSVGMNGNRQAMVNQLISNNWQFATTGRIDPLMQYSAQNNGLTWNDQAKLGNKPALGNAVPGKLNSVLSAAKKQIGVPYVWGGTSSKGFDCSGLVQYAYAKAGIALPRTTYQQIHSGSPVKWGAFRPGDLIFSDFEGTGKPTHVVMYIGNGKVIAAPHTGDHVRIENVNLFKSNFIGARRIVRG